MFPTEVDGLPVLSVAQAVEVFRGRESGSKAAAVAGYYDAFYPSCPYPGRYIGPLERWCDTDVLADTQAGATLCQPSGPNGSVCDQPSGTYPAPFFMSETSGSADASPTGGALGISRPRPVVLIGHVGDPRQWRCTPQTQAECADAFVVDRVAWADGKDVPLAAPDTGDQQTGKLLKPKMTLAQVVARIGLADIVVSGAAFQAGAIATVDPRWNFTGDGLVWLVRTVAKSASSPGEVPRPETVWLVDDATGKVLDSQPLKVDSSYRPARLWPIASLHGVDCCGDDMTRAFERVTAADGTILHAGSVSEAVSVASGTTTFGGGYGSPPLVLPAGRYSISFWLAPYSNGVVGPPRDGCSTQIALGPLDNVSLNADFPLNQPCTIGSGPAPSPGS